ncbi:hypothetical protein BHE74_00051289, partial [Ensete ventricosum]
QEKSPKGAIALRCHSSVREEVVIPSADRKRMPKQSRALTHACKGTLAHSLPFPSPSCPWEVVISEIVNEKPIETMLVSLEWP